MMSRPLFPPRHRLRLTKGNDIGAFTADGHVRTLHEIEREVIQVALAKSGGSVTRAAAQLRIGRSTFYRKLGCPPASSEGSS